MQRTWEPPIRYIVLAVLIALFVALVWYIRSLLQPLLTAGLIAFVLSPGATFVMKRFRIGRRLAATLVYFATLAILLIVVSTVVPAMLDQFDSVRADLQSGLTDLQAVLATPIQFGVFRVDLRLLGPSLAALLYRGPIVPQPSQAIRFLEMTSRGVVWTVVVMVTVYYLMTEWDQLRDWVIHLAPPSERGDLTRLYMQIRTVWGQYLGGQVRLIAIPGGYLRPGLADHRLAGGARIGIAGRLPQPCAGSRACGGGYPRHGGGLAGRLTRICLHAAFMVRCVDAWRIPADQRLQERLAPTPHSGSKCAPA